MERVERSRLLGGLVALLAVAGIIVLSMRAVSAPDPVAGNAPADQFSAERAFAQVEQIGSAVHPTGSAAADDVRAYIVRTLNQLGIATRVQDDIGADEPYNYARVRNVVATLPGTEPTGRVFLFAHYDSASASFGASDDGIGVAVLLDVARALTAEPKPRNDIVFVLTDGEESCLCGAEAFARSDPAAADGGVFLNFDNRGSSGPGIMYRTSPGNSALIAIYQAAVPYPWASGFAAEVNQRLPGDTDFSALIHSGKFVGFDTAQIDASAIYHTPQDRPEYVDMASLQHVGANALALSRALAAADLAPLLVDSGSDASYFSAFSVVISYPVWLIGPLYILDADTGHARWFSDDEHPDPWVAQFVTGQPNSHAEFWPLDDGVPAGAAQAANLTAPMVTVLADTSSDGQRTITVNITPQRSSNRLWLALPDVLPTRATVAGREVQMAELEGQFFVAFYGSPTTGIDVHLVLPGTDPTKLRVGDNSQGLDGIPGYVPRPAGLGLTGARGSDIVTVGQTYTL